MASFVETSNNTNIDNLDNNGILIVAEVIGDDFIAEDRIRTKAEIIINNGEINFFLQPILRYIDFLLIQIMGYLLPDGSKKLSLEDVIEKAA